NDVSEYVYIIRKGKSAGISAKPQIKIYDNLSGFHTYAVNEKAEINGKRSPDANQTTYEAIETGIVASLEIGSDGEVKAITAATKYGEQAKRTYCKYASAFNDDKEGTLPFKFDADTIFFVVPEDDMSDDDYGGVPEYKDGKTFNTQAYDCDPDTDFVKAVVLTVDGEDLSSGDNAKIGIVTKVSQVLDKDGQSTYSIEGYSQGAEFRHMVWQGASVTNVASDLKKGDVIRFNKNYSGDIVRVELLESLSTKNTLINTGVNTTDERFYSAVMEMRKAVISNEAKYLRHALWLSPTMDFADMTDPVYIYADIRNTENINAQFNDYYMYDRTAKTITHASIDDVVSHRQNAQSPSIVYIQSNAGIAQILVIVKD
ncbi:MAG: hypothetical protein LBH54_05150, partial [Clostridiales bacterium]|nr:hypothetical protein [Clostridiales bacterium]